jgi:hypothetical protein
MPIFQGYLSYAPFPEGFQGDMDETFQQSGQLATIYINGNFLTGLYYPVGTTPPPTLPTSDQGPVAIGGQWYFWDPVSGAYLPQSASVKPARNYAKNAFYQVRQTGDSFGTTSVGIASGIPLLYDMSQARVTVSNALSIALDVGPTASPDTDTLVSAIKYTVGPTLVPTLAATDLFAHEHLIEGSDIAGIQGEALSLAFSVWANQPGTFSAYLTNHGRDMSYIFPFTIATANQWTRIKINNIPAMPTTSGTWTFAEGQTGLYLGVVMAVGAQYQNITTKAWVSGFFAGTAQNTNYMTVVNNQMKITGIKLEASPTTTYLVANSFEQDLHDAIRYYYTTFNYQSTNAGIGIQATSWSANAILFSFLFPRRMCRNATVTPYGWTSKASGDVTNISTGADYPQAPTSSGSQKGFNLAVSGVTATKGDVFACFVTADARLS